MNFTSGAGSGDSTGWGLMAIDHTLGLFFKSDAQTNGRKLFAQNKTSLVNASDTFVQAYVKDGSSFKVRLLSDDIASPSLLAECNCVAGKKNRFCKHIWATLLCVEEKNPDFLNEKVNIDKPEAVLDSKPDPAKQRASEYQKAQYQKQKEYLKKIKKDRKLEAAEKANAESLVDYPAEVQTALRYFSKNGFDFQSKFSEEDVSKAKRILSKVFHPDRGGTDNEAAELNFMCEVLFRFLR